MNWVLTMTIVYITGQSHTYNHLGEFNDEERCVEAALILHKKYRDWPGIVSVKTSCIFYGGYIPETSMDRSAMSKAS